MAMKVILADDHKIVRDGLRALIEKTPDMEIVADAETGRQAVELTEKLVPDVVVMDVTMPDLNGIEACRRIVRSSKTKVLALSMHSDRRFVIEMFKAGANGYLLKDCAAEELIRALETVMNGKTYLSPQIADIVVDAYLNRLDHTQPGVYSVLTVREREVLQLLAEGNSTKEIGTRCGVSIKTVETHRQHIMAKLNIQSVAELTKYAIREGLTTLDR